jgi:hypothetical protein
LFIKLVIALVDAGRDRHLRHPNTTKIRFPLGSPSIPYPLPSSLLSRLSRVIALGLSVDRTVGENSEVPEAIAVNNQDAHWRSSE